MPLLLAGGACGLMSNPLAALEIGDLRIQSALGQPLRASIAYALSPNEQLSGHCIFLRPGAPTDNLPMLSNARISVTGNSIVLTGTRPIREPILSMQLTVDCPYTANLTRTFTVMLDPATPVAAASAPSTAAAAAPAATVTADRAVPRRAAADSAPSTESPVAASSTYVVRRGDSVSSIATRISNRRIGLWPAVEAIFAANPDAFVDGDVNRLKAGTTIRIPSMDGTSAPIVAEVASAPAAAASAPESTGSATTAYAGLDTNSAPQNNEPGAAANMANLPASMAPADQADVAPPASAALADDVAETAADLAPAAAVPRPGDLLLGSDAAFVSPIGTDTPVAEAIPSPVATVPPPAQSVPVVASRAPVAATPAKTSGSWSWLIWLSGAGLALIAGLLLFGRKLRARFGSVAVVTPSPQIRDDQDSGATARNPAVADIDFRFDIDLSTDQSFSLDADLGEGTGLSESSSLEVAQDFGFSTSSDLYGELDMEIPEGADQEPEAQPTDIIPPQHAENFSILQEEVMPGAEDADDEYNLSMIIDATRQNLDDIDSTEKDLMAVPAGQKAAARQGFTLNEEIDLTVLEQDYEDELTATQALNAEIAKAALELAGRLDATDDGETALLPNAGSEATVEMPADLADFTSELTAQMPAAAAADATSNVTARLPAALEAENDEFDDTAITGVNEELTVDMVLVSDDVTVEMDIESGRHKSKSRKSAG